jgi:hypothetical protein
MRAMVVASLLLLARVGLAHDVPVDPSTCVLDTVGLEGPATGASVVVAPAGVADRVRVVYDTATSTVQFQPLRRSRGFTAAGETGGVGLPAAFDAVLLSSGDLRAEQVALDVTVGGGTVRVPIALTTGLVGVPGAVVAGQPIDAGGRFVMVGTIPPGVLQSALDGITVVRFGCGLSPVPDLDRFAPATVVESLDGTLSPRGGSLRGVLRDAPGLGALAEPALLEVRVGGEQAAVLYLPDGFQGGGRRRTGRAIEGSRVTLRRGPERGTLRLRADLAAAFLPGTLSGAVDVELTLVSGAMTARGARVFRARGGTVRGGS